MVQAIRQKLTIQRDGHLEVRDPALRKGDTAEVIVLVETEGQESRLKAGSLTAIVGSRRGIYATPEEADAYLHKLRDEWD